MTTFQDLQADHEALLNRHEAPADPAQFWTDVLHYIDRVRVEAAHIPTPREREQLRAILRFWASYLYDKTGTYPDTTLRPAMIGKESKPATIEASVQPTKPPTPTPSPPSIQRAPVVWGLAVLFILAVLVAVMALATTGRSSAPAPSATSEPALPNQVATQVYVQMQVNAAMTEVVATISTPTHTPTTTPTSTPTETPTPTATPTRAPSPTRAIIIPTLGKLPDVVQPPDQSIPLNVGYQILTQGPSPFDATVWVIQLKLVGIGGNGSYIFWVDGRQLPGAEYTVQGKRCEPQTVALGVTSAGQAVKSDVVLKSPLAACFKEQPQ